MPPLPPSRKRQPTLRRQVDQLRLLKDLRAALLGLRELGAVYRTLYELLPQRLAVDRVSLMLYDPDRNALVSDRFLGIDRSDEGLVSAPQPIGYSISGVCFLECRPVVVHDCSDTDLIPANIVTQLQLRSTLAVPLVAHGEVLGVFRVDDTHRTHRFGREDVELLTLIAEELAIVIENARLVSELQRANQVKERFLALLAHELRNPLAAMTHAVEVLNTPHASPRGKERAVGVLARQVAHQTRLIEDLLDIARIGSGKLELRREPVDLTVVVRESVEDFRDVLEHGGLNLVVELPPEPAPVLADPTRLRQVMINLLGNAAKFTSPGGTVRVRVEIAAEREEVDVRVRDTGIGLDPELLTRIFDPFAQAEAGLERSRGGLGLGLALVRALTELHGGRVSARSEGHGQGLEIAFQLPISVVDRP